MNSLTSTKTLLPRDPYKFPFCRPHDSSGSVDIVHSPENLGEWLSGNDIQSSPYNLSMKKDVACKQLCTTYLGRSKTRGVPDLIKNNYHHNMIIDNLPAAPKVESAAYETTMYLNDGFPVGLVGEGGVKYVNNHINIEVHYHPVEGETAKYRVVRFIVEPFSVNHAFAFKSPSADTPKWNPSKSQDPVEITNTDVLKSCSSSSDDTPTHTTFEMVDKASGGVGPQEASGVVLFTYDVKWIESDVKWASRWDIYLSMGRSDGKGGIPSSIHWYQILNSLLITLVLTFMVAAILIRNLRRDMSRYNAIPTDEEKAEREEEFGWKLVHGDVFRPPTQHAMLLAVATGTGMQVLLMSLATVFFSAAGFISPAARGYLIMALLMFYCLCGSAAGYTTARLYKSFKGKMWQR